MTKREYLYKREEIIEKLMYKIYKDSSNIEELKPIVIVTMAEIDDLFDEIQQYSSKECKSWSQIERDKIDNIKHIRTIGDDLG